MFNKSQGNYSKCFNGPEKAKIYVFIEYARAFHD
jgi:hypothetical protein